jgi:predicted RNase H-like HicB family nuclease
MEIPVLIEPVAGNGYQARCGEPVALSADAPTREEALEKLRQLLAKRIAAGAQIVPLTVSQAHPCTNFAGMLKDDPYFDEWQGTIAELRRQEDADPDSP